MSDPRIGLPYYVNPFDPAKGFQALAFHWDRFLGSHELNVVQDIERERIKRIADALLRDGQIVSGGSIVLSAPSGGFVTVTLSDARIYIRGAMHDVEARQLQIPATGIVAVGVRLRSYIVTHEDDTTLKGMAPGTRGEGEPGASALVMRARWGWDGDGEDGDFFPIWTIIDGQLPAEPPQPINDAWLQLLARYDREAHHSYVVEGYRVRALGYSDGDQVFTVSEGTVNVYGFKHSRSTSFRLRVPEEPDLHQIVNEPHAVDSGPQTITVRFGPIHSVDEVTVTREKTVNLTRGPFSGGSDALPDPTVIQIIEVRQGSTVYTSGTNNDYVLSGASVSWAPPGAEPAPGSTYQVTYRYIDQVTPTNIGRTTFDIDGAANGTIAYVKYTMKLPRFDAIVVTRDGQVEYRKGTSSLYAPQRMYFGQEVLKLADIFNDWGLTPQVAQVGAVKIPFHDLRDLERMVADLYALVAEERLQRDVSSREPTSKRGVFVDPFIDDDMRDHGLDQDAAVSFGALTLPIEPDIHFLDFPSTTLDYTEETILAQSRVTRCMRVNPYQAFEIPTLFAHLSPSSDFWTVVIENWSSITTNVFVGAGIFQALHSTEIVERVLSRRTELIEYIRVRQIDFEIDGFGPNEILSEATFDGIDVTPA